MRLSSDKRSTDVHRWRKKNVGSMTHSAPGACFSPFSWKTDFLSIRPPTFSILVKTFGDDVWPTGTRSSSGAIAAVWRQPYGIGDMGFASKGHLCPPRCKIVKCWTFKPHIFGRNFHTLLMLFYRTEERHPTRLSPFSLIDECVLRCILSLSRWKGSICKNITY